MSRGMALVAFIISVSSAAYVGVALTTERGRINSILADNALLHIKLDAVTAKHNEDIVEVGHKITILNARIDELEKKLKPPEQRHRTPIRDFFDSKRKGTE